MAAKIAHEHLLLRKPFDAYSFMYLCIGAIPRYRLVEFRLPDRKYNRAKRRSLELFQNKERIYNFITRVLNGFEFLFDQEYLIYENP